MNCINYKKLMVVKLVDIIKIIYDILVSYRGVISKIY